MRGALARANSQNVPVAQPTTQLNATEQDTLVKQIGLALLRAAPATGARSARSTEPSGGTTS